MKLRQAINEYARWISAVRLAHSRGWLTLPETWRALDELNATIRQLIGEELLEREL